MQLGWQLGLQTILVWKPQMPFLVFLWSTLSVGMHLVCSLAFAFSRTMSKVRRENKTRQEGGTQTILRWMRNEATICAAKKRRGYKQHKQKENAVTLSLNLFAAFMGFILLIFGTTVFSSLLFISPLDALTVIIRYLASTIFCRFILKFELRGLVTSEEAEEQKYT